MFESIMKEGNETGVFYCPSPHIAAVNTVMMAHEWSVKHWMLSPDVDFRNSRRSR